MTAANPQPTVPEQQQWAWKVGHESWQPRRTPRFMGILNVTPDSFSDGGHFDSLQTALQRAAELIDQGADIIDVGGESTRPGADPVSEADELSRVIPVIRAIREQHAIPISIDTTKARVARAAVEAGACIINDISGLTFDAEMLAVCAELDVAVFCMHIQGTPQTMQDNPTYDDAVNDIQQWLERRLDVLAQAGIERERIAIDPGIGFGKTAQHNLELLQGIAQFRALGRPILVGHSRKRFLKKLLNRELDERQWGTVGVSVALAALGVDLIRVHDVAASRDAVLAFQAIWQPSSDR